MHEIIETKLLQDVNSQLFYYLIIIVRSLLETVETKDFRVETSRLTRLWITARADHSAPPPL